MKIKLGSFKHEIGLRNFHVQLAVQFADDLENVHDHQQSEMSDSGKLAAKSTQTETAGQSLMILKSSQLTPTWRESRISWRTTIESPPARQLTGNRQLKHDVEGVHDEFKQDREI